MSVVDVWPVGSMSLLTQYEADSLSLSSQGELYDLQKLLFSSLKQWQYH